MKNKRLARRGAVQSLDSDSNTQEEKQGEHVTPPTFQSEGAEYIHFYDMTPTF